MNIRLMSFVLTLVMLFSCLPTAAFAQEEPLIAETEAAAAETPSESETIEPESEDLETEAATEPEAAETEAPTEEPAIPETEAPTEPKQVVLSREIIPALTDLPRTAEDIMYGEPQIVIYDPVDYVVYSDECLTTPGQFASAVREAMVNREDEITITYQSAKELTSDELAALVEAAYDETGVPYEGDYLRFCAYWIGIQALPSIVDGGYLYTIVITLENFSNAQQEALVTEQVAAALDSFGFTSSASDYYKVKTIYEYIWKNVAYDYSADDGTRTRYTAYAAICNKTAVCQGYALLLYRMLMEAGITARVIPGTSLGENHAWNIAKLDGLYYNLDATWDASARDNRFFLKSDENFSDHTRQAGYTTESFYAAYPMDANDYVPDASNTVTANGMTFQIDNGSAVLTKYSGTKTSLTIPGSVQGYPVTAIGGNAFFNNTALTSVTIPASVQEIQDGGSENWDYYGAFYGCSALEKVTFAVGSKLHTIGEFAFYYCTSLTNVTLPDSIQTLGISAFEGCRKITSLTLPEGLVTISQNALDSTGLTQILIPASCQNYHIWNDLPNLTAFQVAEGNPWYYALDGVLFYTDGATHSLIAYPMAKTGTSYTMPNRVTQFDGLLQGSTFSENPYLKTVIFPTQEIDTPGKIAIDVQVGTDNPYHKSVDGLIYSKDGTILQQVPRTKTGTLTVPEGVIRIEDYACEDRDIHTLILPDSLREIGSAAFWFNDKLASVTMGKNVEAIEASAFQGCTSLSAITLPQGLTAIDQMSFQDCTALTDIEIPASVKLVDFQAFSGCYSLRSVKFLGSAPDIHSIAFNLITATAYYPSGDSTWTSAVRQNYGGSITWKAYTSESTAPAAPVLKAYGKQDNGKPMLTWAKVDGAAKYELYYAPKGSTSYKKLITTVKNTITHTGAAAGNVYNYKVRAVAEDGTKSEFSNVKSVRCYAAVPTLSARAKRDDGKPTMIWKAISGASCYQIRRREVGTTKWTTFETTYRTYTNTGAVAGKLYEYQIRALDSVRYPSNWSDSVKMYCYPKVPTLELSLTAAGKPSLSWDKSPGATGYLVYVSEDGGAYRKLTQRTSTTVKHTGAKAGVTYKYYVKAYAKTSAGTTIYSNTSDVITIILE